jgi:hypothetical protein
VSHHQEDDPVITTSPHTRRVIAAALTASAVTLWASGCSDGDAEADSTTDTATVAPAPTEAATDEDTATTEPTSDAGPLFDGSTLVDLQTYAGTWVATTAEGAVTTIDDPAASEVPSTWVIEPADAEGAYHLVSSATTDDREMCLTLPGDDVVNVSTCDPADAGQQLSIASLDQVEQVNISNANGYLVSDPEGGLAVEPDPSSPASVFTLVERGAAG